MKNTLNLVRQLTTVTGSGTGTKCIVPIDTYYTVPVGRARLLSSQRAARAAALGVIDKEWSREQFDAKQPKSSDSG